MSADRKLRFKSFVPFVLVPVVALAACTDKTEIVGKWGEETPQDGSTITTNHLELQAHASPINPKFPEIKDVIFEGVWQGKEITLCIAQKPTHGDIFTCEVDLKALNTPKGEFEIGFTPENEYISNKNPDGTRTIIYEPPN